MDESIKWILYLKLLPIWSLYKCSYKRDDLFEIVEWVWSWWWYVKLVTLCLNYLYVFVVHCDCTYNHYISWKL